MQDAKAPVTAASKRSIAATAALLLLSAPVLAATGLDVLCERSAEHVDRHALDELSLDTIDHALNSRITSEDELGGGDDEAQEILPAGIREQEILRRIFDEPVSNAATESASSSEAPADVNAPQIEERSADVADTDLSDQEAVDSLLPGIRLPDATPEETRRYRRQMFRTDI